MNACRLYLITPPALPDPGAFAEILAEALGQGDVAALQLRLKDASDESILRIADVLRPITEARQIALIMNDRPDLARKSGCDGVHIGQDDAPYAEARAALGANGIVGVTCHDSRHLAISAAESGADYVAFGAFFPTATKTPKSVATPDILQWWSEMMVVPAVAIGGITPENCQEVVEAGADFIAVSAGIWSDPEGPGAAIRKFDRILSGG